MESNIIDGGGECKTFDKLNSAKLRLHMLRFSAEIMSLTIDILISICPLILLFVVGIRIDRFVLRGGKASWLLNFRLNHL